MRQWSRTRIDLDPRQLDKREVSPSDYDEVLAPPGILVDAESGDVVAIHDVLPRTVGEQLYDTLRHVRFIEDFRTGGLPTRSRVFGFEPRKTLRKDFCGATSLASQDPKRHATLCGLAAVAGELYHKHRPDQVREHRRLVRLVRPEYRLPGGCFTSGIANDNNALRYHRDRGNYEGLWSAMLVARRHVDGGLLVIPEYRVALACPHASIVLFNGSAVPHGVSPLRRTGALGHRFSVVFYALRQMWKCEAIADELARIRSVKTDRERKRADYQPPAAPTTPVWPIYVPSKGRPRGATVTILRAAGLRPTVCIEPQDVSRYQAALGDSVAYAVLPADNQGITVARNFVLAQARAAGHGTVWMLDDDLEALYTAADGKVHVEPAAHVLARAQELFATVPGQVVQGALEYAQYAWSAKDPLTLGSYADAAVALHLPSLDALGIAYRAPAEMKEDRDLTLQIIRAGGVVARARQLAFRAPKNGANAGGLHGLYQQRGRERAAVQAMLELWPAYCTPVTKPDGREDVKINWRLARTDAGTRA